MRLCVTCKEEFDDGGSHWKRQCYDCWKNYKTFDGKYGGPTRIRNLGHKASVFITHPSVTADDVNEFIKQRKLETGWGAREWTPEHDGKFKIFINDENYD